MDSCKENTEIVENSESENTENKGVIILTLDEKKMFIHEKYFTLLKTIEKMTDDINDECGDDKIIPLSIHSKTIEKILEFCEFQLNNNLTFKHVEDLPDTPLKKEITKLNNPTWEWIFQFYDIESPENINDTDLKRIANLVLAANYLDFEILIHSTCKIIASIIKLHSPEWIKSKFEGFDEDNENQSDEEQTTN